MAAGSAWPVTPRKLVLFENGTCIKFCAFLRAEGRVIIVAAEIVIGLRAHDNIDGHLIAQGINLREQGGDFVKVLFVSHFKLSRVARGGHDALSRKHPAGDDAWRSY